MSAGTKKAHDGQLSHKEIMAVLSGLMMGIMVKLNFLQPK